MTRSHHCQQECAEQPPGSGSNPPSQTASKFRLRAGRQLSHGSWSLRGQKICTRRDMRV